MTVSVTSDFKHAYEVDRRERMRRRIVIYTLVMGIVQLVLLPITGAFFDPGGWEVKRVGFATLVLLSAVCYLGTHLYLRRTRTRFDRGAIVWFAIALILVAAFLRLPMALFGNHGEGFVPPIVMWSTAVFLSHLIGSFFIPWTAREALIPFGPFLLMLGVLGYDSDGAVGILGALVLGIAIAAPGTALAWYQYSQYRERFQSRFFRKAYRKMKRELVDARRIHEDLFPPELLEGPITVRYLYEPMSHIGGDYLFIRDEPGSTTLVVIDVTGHGVAAALTINRLHGELQRLLGEHPDASPGTLLTALNRYIHFTLATHSVYATAWCARADHNAGGLVYASAGHPPAFLIGVDHTIEQLESTTFMLGVTHGDDFIHDERRVPFHPGDTLLVYTDGATEARDSNGRMIGVRGFLAAVASMSPDQADWARTVARFIDDFRDGPPEDDTLIVAFAHTLED